uniref:Uncharacterized protein n=1 Tax=Siphoviridae sp. ctcfw7 TaxID=2826394 RepID=A0A8S5MGG6_9CAUD|nr:MAG TPA: hypothetical protein [Siphoviridae sp. ctcfw7]
MPEKWKIRRTIVYSTYKINIRRILRRVIRWQIDK